MKTRLSLAAIALLLVAPLSLFAQSRSSELGLFIVGSRFSNSDRVEDAGNAHFDYSEKSEYGVSYRRYSSNDVSTEFAFQKIRSDLNITGSGAPGSGLAGTLSASTITALEEWHFLRGSLISPYFGAGLAHIFNGDFAGNQDFQPGTQNDHTALKSKTTWSAAVGADIRIADRLSLAAELKYIPWTATDKYNSPGIRVNPTTLAVGVRFRL